MRSLSQLFRRVATPATALAHQALDGDEQPDGVLLVPCPGITLEFTTEFENVERSSMPASTHLTPDMHFVGDVTQEGPLELLGSIYGNVTVSGAHCAAVIAEGAQLVGSVKAAVIDIHGAIDGTVEGGALTIHETAYTRGNVLYDRIAILGGDNDINLKRRPKAE